MNAKLILVLLLQTSIGSLQSQINYHNFGNQNDSLRLMSLLEETRKVYSRNQFDSVILLSENILEECLELGFLRGVGESYFLKARALNRLGRKEKAMEIYQSAVEQFKAIQDHTRIASVYNNWGLILKSMGRFREAIETGEMALDYIRQKPSDKLQFHILNNLGNSYQNIALFKKASSAYFEALQVLKNQEDSLYKQQMQAEVYINLGIIYFEQKLFSKSIETYQNALEIFSKQELKPQLATVYNNLAVVLIETQDYNKAKHYLLIADSLYRGINGEIGVAICTNNLGKIYRELQNFDDAILKHNQAINTLLEIGNVSYLPSCYLGLGKTFMEAQLVDKAHLSLLKGLQIALKSGQKVPELKLYEGLIELHKSINNLEETIMYYDLYSSLSQELNDQQIGRYIGQQELKEHIEKRDLALESLESEAAFLQFQLNQRNLLLVLSAFIILLVSAFFTLVLRQFRLKALHQSITLEQKILRTQLNPHFIFNALGAIQHYMIDHAPEKAAGYLSKFSKLMRSILECSRTSDTTLSVELENMRHYLELQSLRFSGLFEFSIEMDSEIQPELVRIPSLLIQPLLENAVEHGLIPNQGGQLRVIIQQKNDYIIVYVEDDGVGVDHHRSLNTGRKDKSSLGNTIIRERLSLINRKNKNKILFNIRSRTTIDSNLSGTQASLKIPLN